MCNHNRGNFFFNQDYILGDMEAKFGQNNEKQGKHSIGEMNENKID